MWTSKDVWNNGCTINKKYNNSRNNGFSYEYKKPIYDEVYEYKSNFPVYVNKATQEETVNLYYRIAPLYKHFLRGNEFYKFYINKFANKSISKNIITKSTTPNLPNLNNSGIINVKENIEENGYDFPEDETNYDDDGDYEDWVDDNEYTDDGNDDYYGDLDDGDKDIILA